MGVGGIRKKRKSEEGKNGEGRGREENRRKNGACVISVADERRQKCDIGE